MNSLKTTGVTRRWPILTVFLTTLMRIRSGKRVIFAMVAVILICGSVAAQTKIDTLGSLPGITIETSIDRAESYIGDLINYKVTITYDSTYELVPPPLGANLGAFDVKDYQTDIITRLPDGRIRSENNFVLSTFTTGDYIIPPIPALFNLPDSSRKMILSEGVPIKILSLLAEGSDSLNVRPLKAPYEFKRDRTKEYVFAGLAFLALVLIGLWAWLNYRRKAGLEGPVDNRPPWEIAFERLAMLKEEKLPETERHKEFYIELTEIVRFYLGRMYLANVLDMTTEEFLDDFRERELPGDLYREVSEFLGHADLIKFAKMAPEPARPQTDLQFAHDLVARVRTDFERQQAAVEQNAPGRLATREVNDDAA